MNTIALNLPDWVTWIMDRHIPSIVLAVALVVFVVMDLGRPEE